jgi:signal peptidase I
VGLALALRVFVGEAYVIPSGSMRPLLLPGDRVLVLTLGQGPDAVRRGDVVVFDGKGLFDTSGDEHEFVKRVIGLPGDRITCCDPEGRLLVDGEPLDEPYVYPGNAPSELRFDVQVPDDRLWLMGDHRGESADSRAHLGDPGGGMVPVNRVAGRVTTIVWPLSRLGGVGRHDYTPLLNGDGAAR